uniref:Podocalyxin n=1 Tax=Oryzias latipes TaxID=8090 RepID=A0A3P9LLM4_ORYLA
MRATLRITGLLVLSSLFSSICSDKSSNFTASSTIDSFESAAVLSKAPGSTEAPLNTSVPATTQKPTDTVDTVTSIKAAITTAPAVTDVLTPTPGSATLPPAVTSGLLTTGAASTQPPPTFPSVQTTSQQENMTTGPGEAEVTAGVIAGVTEGFNTKPTTMITTTLRPEYSNSSGENHTEGSRAPATTTAPTAPPSEAPTPPVTTPSTTTTTITTTSLAKTEPAKTQVSHTQANTEFLPSVGPGSTVPAGSHTFAFPPPSGQLEKKEQKVLGEVCKRLFPDWRSGTCKFEWRQQNGGIVFDRIEIIVNSSLAANYYEDITKPRDNKTLIAILASCGSLLIMIIILAVCASHHRRPYSENQQHLTEELQTVENGYHDNPTLEVMEVQPEMQEKKLALNGEFNDSWIVPIDNLLKEEVPDEEDTHL